MLNRDRRVWFLSTIALAALSGCAGTKKVGEAISSIDWCSAAAKVAASAQVVLPSLQLLVPEEAAILTAGLSEAQAGVDAIGCDGDRAGLGERIQRLTMWGLRVLAVYAQHRGRDIERPLSDQETADALELGARLNADIARERGSQ